MVRASSSDRTLALLEGNLRDERGRRVVFVSHCLLNENTRYLGGACHPGAVPEVLRASLREGTGLCQMPCPEQRAWGGVLKRRLLPLFGSAGSRHGRLLRIVGPAFLLGTRVRYAWLAHRVAMDIVDYRRSGFDVCAVVGVGGSPSCGVRTTLDIGRAMDAVARCDPRSTSTTAFNERAIVATAIPGEGLFMAPLRRALARRGIRIPFREHDLIAELRASRP